MVGASSRFAKVLMLTAPPVSGGWPINNLRTNDSFPMIGATVAVTANLGNASPYFANVASSEVSEATLLARRFLMEATSRSMAPESASPATGASNFQFAPSRSSS